MHAKNRLRLTLFVSFAIIFLFLGLFVAQHWHKARDLSAFHGTLLNQPRAIEPFSLTGINAQPFDNQSLQGHWTLAFFGFTSCHSICPTTMAELAKMMQLLEEKKAASLPEVVLISLDPKNDNSQQLKHYVHAFNPHFFAAYGEEASLKQMTRDLGIAYINVSQTEGKVSSQDAIEHTGTLLLFNPQGQLAAFFTMPHQAANLAQDYLLLVS